MIKYIKDTDNTIAIIIKNSYNESGIHFFTDNNSSQQLAHMHHPTGKKIDVHIHCPQKREIDDTQETIFIRKGKLEVDFYDKNQNYISSYILAEGDVLLLISGGHGFRVIEEVDMVEVKQGPYLGEKDKIRFNGITK